MDSRFISVRWVPAEWPGIGLSHGPEYLNDSQARFPSAHGWTVLHMGNNMLVEIHGDCAPCARMADWLAAQPEAVEV